MPIFHRPESRFYWYCFAVEGRRYRGSTKVTNKTTAEMISGKKFLEVVDGRAPLPRKAPRLEEFAERFLSWGRKIEAEGEDQALLPRRVATLVSDEDRGMALD